MNTIPYKELRKYKDYRVYRRTQKFRALAGFICVIIFWAMMHFANNPEFNDSYKIPIYIILGLISITSLYSMYIAFIKIPIRIEGVIEDCRSTNRIVRRGDNLDGASYILEYGINYNGEMIYGRNATGYTGVNYKKLDIGDEVIYFSFGKGNVGYFIKK